MTRSTGFDHISWKVRPTDFFNDMLSGLSGDAWISIPIARPKFRE